MQRASRAALLPLLGLILLTSTNAKDVCEPCELSTCASVDHCEAGVVLDDCSCCQICALKEGELCDERGERKFGNCGDNLVCQLDKETQESTCTCTQVKMVCGSDDVTYDTPCQLNEESVRRSADKNSKSLTMAYWGPCNMSPIIVSPPTDTYGARGANLTLDCEAKGFPAPTITWQYDNVEGETILLPSDDQMISVQMRGGPEPMMATGWAQIISLHPSYSGTYHCIASNNQGSVHASASVGVFRGEQKNQN